MEILGRQSQIEDIKEGELFVQEISVDPEYARTLHDALQENNLSSGDVSEKDIFEAGARLRDNISQPLEKALAGMAAKKSRHVALLIKGLPIERPVGMTRNGRESEILLAAVGSFLGQPFVAEGHREGRYFLDLIPKEADAAKELGTGTELQWHSEDAQLLKPARFICLLGLRGDKDAQTHISTVQVNALDPRLVSLLSQPLYTFASDESYESVHREVAPVISADDTDVYRLRYDVKFTKCASVESTAAFEALRRVFDVKYRSFAIDTGDLFIFNNKIGAHRRSVFTPSFTDEDRWVQRLMLT